MVARSGLRARALSSPSSPGRRCVAVFFFSFLSHFLLQEPYRRDGADRRSSQQYMPQSMRDERVQREREAQEQSRRLVQEAARREKRR